MDRGNRPTNRRKPTSDDPAKNAEITAFARGVAHDIEVKLIAWLSSEPARNGDGRRIEALWYGERGEDFFSFLRGHKSGGPPFSEREAEIAARRLKGLSAKEIATLIARSVRTVEHHIERYQEKVPGTGCAPLDLLLRPEVLEHLADGEATPPGRDRPARELRGDGASKLTERKAPLKKDRHREHEAGPRRPSPPRPHNGPQRKTRRRERGDADPRRGRGERR